MDTVSKINNDRQPTGTKLSEEINVQLVYSCIQVELLVLPDAINFQKKADIICILILLQVIL